MTDTDRLRRVMYYAARLAVTLASAETGPMRGRIKGRVHHLPPPKITIRQTPAINTAGITTIIPAMTRPNVSGHPLGKSGRFMGCPVCACTLSTYSPFALERAERAAFIAASHSETCFALHISSYWTIAMTRSSASARSGAASIRDLFAGQLSQLGPAPTSGSQHTMTPPFSGVGVAIIAPVTSSYCQLPGVHFTDTI